MDLVINLVALCGLSVPVGLAAALFVRRGPELLAQTFNRSPSLGWPHGVQEEDLDARHWDTRVEPAPGPARAPAFAIRFDADGELLADPIVEDLADGRAVPLTRVHARR